jgi:hypothetical protein
MNERIPAGVVVVTEFDSLRLFPVLELGLQQMTRDRIVPDTQLADILDDLRSAALSGRRKLKQRNLESFAEVEIVTL